MKRRQGTAAENVKKAAAFNAWIHERREAVGILTESELARAAGVAASTLSMMATRLPSPRVAMKLAAVLAGREPVSAFTRVVLQKAGYTAVDTPTSILDRVKERKQIRAALIDYAPFSNPQSSAPSGFVIDFFDHMAALLDATVEYKRIQFGDLQAEAAARNFDVFVSGLFPTFHRRTFLQFTRPLPFIRVPLTAVRRDAVSLRATDILSWTKLETARNLERVKLLVVNGEVGDEFLRVFLRAINPADSHLVARVNSLDPAAIQAAMAADGANVLLADQATCSAVVRHGDAAGLRFVSNDDGAAGASLAEYRVAFAAPLEAGDEWISMLNRAMESLLAEGLHVLNAVYLRHKHLPNSSFAEYLVKEAGTDETVPPHVRSVFGNPHYGSISR
jgi:hypothetical protein